MTDSNQAVSLTEARKNRLRELEARVQNSLSDFRLLVDSLLEIKRDALYEETNFHSFQGYLIGRWPTLQDFCKSRLSQLITAAEVIADIQSSEKFNNVKQAGNYEPPLPDNPRQAYALKDVPAPERGEAWLDILEKAEEEGVRPTAAYIRANLAEDAPPPMNRAIAKQHMAEARKEKGLPEPQTPEREKRGSGFEYIQDSFCVRGRFVHMKFLNRWNGNIIHCTYPTAVLIAGGWIRAEAEEEEEE